MPNRRFKVTVKLKLITLHKTTLVGKIAENVFFLFSQQTGKRLNDLAEHPTKFYTDPLFNDLLHLHSKHIVKRKPNRIQNGDQVRFCKVVKAIILH